MEALWLALKPVVSVLLEAVLPFLWEKLNAPDTAVVSKPNTPLDDLWMRRR